MSEGETDFVKKKTMHLDRLIERAFMGIMGVLLYWTASNQWEMSKTLAVHTNMLDNHSTRIMMQETVTADLKAIAVRMDMLREGQVELKKTLEEHMRSKK